MKGILFNSLLICLVNILKISTYSAATVCIEGVAVSHESNCNLYYECNIGGFIVRKCPNGLHFNVELQVCDYPSDAKCKFGENYSTLSPIVSTEPTAIPTPAPTNLSACPPDSEALVLLPHPKCNLFYTCYVGTPIELACPEGQHFNPIQNYCDWPVNANCVNGGAPEQPGAVLLNGTNTESTQKPVHPETPTENPIKPPPTNQSSCPPDSEALVLLPHPNCNLFYTCNVGTPIELACPEGQHFNPIQNYCDWPVNANCVNGGAPEQPGAVLLNSTNTEATQKPVHPETPTENPINPPPTNQSSCPPDSEAVILLPHPNCNLFYTCNVGTPIELACPEGQHFNPIQNYCDWPVNANCVNGGAPEQPGAVLLNGTNTESTQKPVNPETPTENPIKPPPTNQSSCPPDSEALVLLPHPKCNLFYTCYVGTPIELACPEGQHFNPIQNYCDWPVNANCVNGGALEQPGAVLLNGTNTESTQKPVHPETPTENPIKPPPTNQSSCPPDSEALVLLPHPNCNLFYTCNVGTPIELACPEGQHFNPIQNYCDWPVNANCVNGGASEQPGAVLLNGTNTESTQKPVHPETPTENPIKPPPTNQSSCPPDSEALVLLPHPNCNLFYTCNVGTPIELACPEGQHFNPIQNYCDWPVNANCVNGGAPEQPGAVLLNGTNTESTQKPVHPETPTENPIKPPPTNQSSCPPDSEALVLLPHPNCNLFYTCNVGTPIELACPEGQHFNPIQNYCDWPVNANCVNGGAPEQPGAVLLNGTNTESTQKPVHPETPTENPIKPPPTNQSSCPPDSEALVLLPHPNCNLFYTCNVGTPIELACPEGQHFNPIQNYCDWPVNANCVNGGAPEQPGAVLLNGTNTESTQKPVHPETPTENPIKPPPTNQSSCPPDSEALVLLPHPNCNLFYTCNVGTPIELACPEGQHFNPIQNYCDWPVNANCVNGGAPEQPGAVLLNGTNTESTQKPVHPETPTENPIKPPPTNQSSCPPDSEALVLLPHPNCNLFYTCYVGTPIEFACPEGQHFNPIQNYCDWPVNANCVNGGAPEQPGAVLLNSTNTEVTQKPVNPANPTENPIKPPPTNQSSCPPDSEALVLLPHPKCNLFYTCYVGTPIEFACPEGQHFNPIQNYCDWPVNANCVNGGAPEQPGAVLLNSTNTEVTQKPVNPANPTENPIKPPPTNQSSCPPDSEALVLLPHPKCNLFYTCYVGTPIEFACPEGQHFNPIQNYCDWPVNANCVNGGAPEQPGAVLLNSTNTEATQKPVHPETPTENPIKPPPSNQSSCPPDSEALVLLPHPNCNLFYTCNFGTPIEFACPEGQHFNPIQNYCDWPVNANCVNGGAPEQPGAVLLNSTEITTQGTPQSTVFVETTTVNIPNSQSTTSNPGSTSPSLTCPTENIPDRQIYLAHANCNRFYQCDWGVPYEMICSDGLHFNPEINICDAPVEAKCTEGSAPQQNGAVLLPF